MLAKNIKSNVLLNFCKSFFADSEEKVQKIKPIKGDASSRLYYRITTTKTTYLLMHTTNDQKCYDDFLQIGKQWHESGLPVPKIFSNDKTKALMLLEDFGQTQLLSKLENTENADHFYNIAIDDLLQIQRVSNVKSLPAFNAAMIKEELDLFPTWCLNKLLNIELDNKDQEFLKKFNYLLLDELLSQPYVTTHRDYHSRNIMVVSNDKLGIIDFQDAVAGPITYDIVSLLRDCYIAWPQQKTYDWLKKFIKKNEILNQVPYEHIQKWFDFTGVQRHIKVLGIFSRLSIRDGKLGYLKDMPRVFAYIMWVCSRYQDLQEVFLWLQEKVAPKFQSLSWWKDYKITMNTSELSLCS